VLVIHDLVGLSLGRVPRFVRPYADSKAAIAAALATWRADVEAGRFPGPDETLG
jgi:3-methyl-2-oxobutanoate hydroxymethyltransferase